MGPRVGGNGRWRRRRPRQAPSRTRRRCASGNPICLQESVVGSYGFRVAVARLFRDGGCCCVIYPGNWSWHPAYILPRWTKNPASEEAAYSNPKLRSSNILIRFGKRFVPFPDGDELRVHRLSTAIPWLIEIWH